MMKKESKFKNLPPPIDNVIVLGGLVFDDPKLQGPGARLDLSGYKNNLPLARDFIASLTKYVAIGQLSERGSLSAYYACIREFLQYCQEKEFTPKMRMRDIDDDFLRDYRAYLVDSTLHRKSERRRRRYGDLLRLLRAGKELGLWSSKYAPPRNFQCIDDGDKTQAYMGSELIDVEAACRNEISNICGRIERRKELLAQGVDARKAALGRNKVNGQILKKSPADRPWNQLPNLLWYVENVLNGEYIKNEVLKNGHSSFVKAVGGGYGGKYRMTDIYSFFYPLNSDMAPFLNLLEKRLGLNETSLIELKRNCLRPLGDGYILDYVKRRGARRRKQEPLVDDGPYSGVAIIKTLLRITEPLVQFAADEHKDILFLCLTIRANKTNPVKPLDACYAKYLMNRPGGWAEQQGLKDQHGETLKLHSRSFRVSKLTKSYLSTGNYKTAMRQGAHANADTTINHYLNNRSTAEIHDRTVAAGISNLRALSKPKVITEDSIPAAAKSLSISESVAEKILQGKQDVFIAACRDFRNRPGAESNTPCDDAWGCLYCANAIITTHVLPRLIAFRDYVIAEQDILTIKEWNEKFGNVLDIIKNEILPQFKDVVIRDAERHASNMDFYVPIHFQTR